MFADEKSDIFLIFFVVAQIRDRGYTFSEAVLTSTHAMF